MSEENVELVRSMYEAFNRRDWESAFGLAAPGSGLPERQAGKAVSDTQPVKLGLSRKQG